MPEIIRDVTKIREDYVEHSSPEAFLSVDTLVSALHGIRHRDDVYTDVIYWNSEAPITIVCFNGAGFPANGIRPGFSGTSMFREWRNQRRANFLFVHDATLYLSNDLSLAWYGGSQAFSYQSDLEQIIRRFVDHSGGSRLIFFGVSGGGHAALYYSARFPGSHAVAANPQTNIDDYQDWAKNKYYDLCWKDDSGRLDNSSLIHDLPSVYTAGTENYAYCLVNINDHHHVQDHLAPLVEAAAPHLRVRTLLRHWGTGHTAAPPQFLIEFFEELVKGLENDTPFPPVKGSRLLESREDVAAVAATQPLPVTSRIVDGRAPLGDVHVYNLGRTINGTLEFTARLHEDADNDSERFTVELRTSRPADSTVYGLRLTETGYEFDIVATKSVPKLIRVFLPEHVLVHAVALRPAPGTYPVVAAATIVSYSNHPLESHHG